MDTASTDTVYLIQEGKPDSLGRVPYTAFWMDPDGAFRAEPSIQGDGPVGYRRAQVFKTATPPDEMFPRSKVVQVSTSAEAERLGHRRMTRAEITQATEVLEGTLDRTGIHGQARKLTEDALAWLQGQ